MKKNHFIISQSPKLLKMNQGDKKYCPKCKAIKPRMDFCRNSYRYDGVSPYCKICTKEYYKQRHAARYPHIREAIVKALETFGPSTADELIYNVQSALQDDCISNYTISQTNIWLVRNGRVENRGKISPSGKVNCSIYALPGQPIISRRVRPTTSNKMKDFEDDDEHLEWMRGIERRKAERMREMA